MDTMLDYLTRWAADCPDQKFATFLDRQGDPLEAHTYRTFEARTRLLAEYLLAETVLRRGDRVVLMYAPGLEMVAAFIACTRIGAIPVPVPPLTAGGQGREQRLISILQDSGAVLGLTDSATRPATTAPGTSADALASLGVTWLVTDLVRGDPREDGREDHPVDVLYLQYTSGSTGAPKGVVVTHQNVIHNCHATTTEQHPVGVSWLPQFHDMGLVGYYLFPIVTGGTVYGFSPMDFLRRPVLWFEALSRYAASFTSSPNFGFEYCLSPDRVCDEALHGCDLSAVEVFMSGAETVRPSIFRQFLQRFQRYGLRPEAQVAFYGLAENTLAVTGSGRRSLRITRRSLKSGAVQPAPNDSPASQVLEIVSSGRSLDGIDARIVNPDTRVPVGDREVGEIWVAGKSTCEGYWNNPELTDHVFDNSVCGEPETKPGYLRTGDLGFRDDGELFVCGRLKDVVILRGQNYFPDDLEDVVEAASEKVQRGCVAAFRGIDGDERLVLAVGLCTPGDRPHPDEITAALRVHGYPGPHTILFVRRQEIRKTTSGKVARRLNRHSWLDGEMRVIETHHRDGAPALLPAPANGNLQSQYASFLAAYALGGDENASAREVGLDSLGTVELLLLLERGLDREGARELRDALDIPLLQRLQISQISALVHRLDDGTAGGVVGVRAHLDQLKAGQSGRDVAAMRRDAVLESPTRQTPPPAGVEFECVLMTGGTGFLGPFLLSSLLAQTQARFRVLVRADDPSAGRERLRTALRSVGRYDARVADSMDARVDVVCGNVASPRLGLSDRHWFRLAESVDTIVHNAASVDYLRDYDALQRSNVEGTRTLVELARTARGKALHFVSSTTIFGWSAKRILTENDSNAEMTELDFGYAQTKWVAERLIFAARAQGVDATIYRPGFLTASTTGHGHSTDIVARLLSFMIRHRLAPEAWNQLSLMPVDLAAHNLAAVMTSDPHAPVHHVTVDDYFNIVDVTRQITEDYGIPFRYVPLNEFAQAMYARCTPVEPAFPLIDFVARSHAKVARMEHKRYENSEFRGALTRSGVGIPDPSLRETVAYLMVHMSGQGMIARYPRNARGASPDRSGLAPRPAG